MVHRQKLPAYSLVNKNKVYQPAEDSFLMLDCLDALFNNGFFKNISTIIDLGSGTGILGKYVLDNINITSIIIGVDRNTLAAETTRETYLLSANRTFGSSIVAKSLKGFRSAIADLIIFNPVSIFSAKCSLTYLGCQTKFVRN